MEHGYRRLLSAGTITGDDIYNFQDEKVGSVEEIMIDLEQGKVAYAVMAAGGFLGMGERYFAVPWPSLKVDEANKRLLLDVNKERLEQAEGFDKNNWPDMTSPEFKSRADRSFGVVG